MRSKTRERGYAETPARTCEHSAADAVSGIAIGQSPVGGCVDVVLNECVKRVCGQSCPSWSHKGKAGSLCTPLAVVCMSVGKNE